MAYTLGNKWAKNLCKRKVLLQLIIENVVTCFLEHSVEVVVVASALDDKTLYAESRLPVVSCTLPRRYWHLSKVNMTAATMLYFHNGYLFFQLCTKCGSNMSRNHWTWSTFVPYIRLHNILDFENLQFLSCSPRRHTVLLPHTKFRWNRTICWWVMAKEAIFKMAADFDEIWCQISSKSDNFWLKYDDLTIFKMAAVRHLWF